MFKFPTFRRSVPLTGGKKIPLKTKYASAAWHLNFSKEQSAAFADILKRHPHLAKRKQTVVRVIAEETKLRENRAKQLLKERAQRIFVQKKD
jgi:hypothetical protein